LLYSVKLFHFSAIVTIREILQCFTNIKTIKNVEYISKKDRNISAPLEIEVLQENFYLIFDDMLHELF